MKVCKLSNQGKLNLAFSKLVRNGDVSLASHLCVEFCLLQLFFAMYIHVCIIEHV